MDCTNKGKLTREMTKKQVFQPKWLHNPKEDEKGGHTKSLQPTIVPKCLEWFHWIHCCWDPLNKKVRSLIHRALFPPRQEAWGRIWKGHLQIGQNITKVSNRIGNGSIKTVGTNVSIILLVHEPKREQRIPNVHITTISGNGCRDGSTDVVISNCTKESLAQRSMRSHG